MNIYIYMFANPSSQQGVPCLWLALSKASLTSRHGITFVPLREVGRPRPSTHRCNWLLAICLYCVKLTVREAHPLDMLNLLPVWVAFYTVCYIAEKEWFLTGKSRAQTLVKTLPSAYGAGSQSKHGSNLIYGRLACKWWQPLNRSTGSSCTSTPTTRITSSSPTTITTRTTSRRGG